MPQSFDINALSAPLNVFVFVAGGVYGAERRCQGQQQSATSGLTGPSAY